MFHLDYLNSIASVVKVASA